MLTRREFSSYLVTGATALVTSGEVWPASKPEALQDQSKSLDCDLLIKGGTVIDSDQKLHGLLDVAVNNGRILAVSPNIPEGRARMVVSAKDKIVTPGFIDIHVHCFDGVGTGANADHYCLGRGVTTVVDAGSTGYPMINAFIKYVVNTSITRIVALVDISALGIVVHTKDTMRNLDWVNPELTEKAAEENKPTVVGIKVRLQKDIQGTNDLECLRRALQAADAARLPLTVHIDDSYSPLPDILKFLRKGDVFTHYLNGHPNGVLDANGKLLPAVLEARERGVIFDPAQGSSHFSFDVAEKCLAQNFLPDTISTDRLERPVYDLPTQVSKFVALGIDLDKAIEMVTVKPAQVYNYGLSLGTLRSGTEADIGIFEIRDGNFEFMDSNRQKRTGHKMLVNKAVVRRGRYFVNEN
jgi:dihydroorotase